MADVAEAIGSLDERIRRLQRLSKLNTVVAADVLGVMQQTLERGFQRGVGSDGQPWQRTKDGRVPLRNAPSEIQYTTVNDVVIVALDWGRHARHHVGAVKGKIKRPILPMRKAMTGDDALSKAVLGTIDVAMRETLEGKR